MHIYVNNKKFISYTGICLYGKNDNGEEIINDVLLTKVYKSFIELYKSYLILEEGMPINFITGKKTNEEYVNEFNKRYNNFYLTIEEIKKEIDNMSEDKINIIKNTTLDFNQKILEKMESLPNQYNHIQIEKIKYRIEKIKHSVSFEIKSLIKAEMNFDWLKEYHDHADREALEGKQIEPIDQEIDDIFDELIRNPRSNFVKKVNFKENEHRLAYDNTRIIFPKIEQYGTRTGVLSAYAERLEDFKEEYNIINKPKNKKHI